MKTISYIVTQRKAMKYDENTSFLLCIVKQNYFLRWTRNYTRNIFQSRAFYFLKLYFTVKVRKKKIFHYIINYHNYLFQLIISVIYDFSLFLSLAKNFLNDKFFRIKIARIFYL